MILSKHRSFFLGKFRFWHLKAVSFLKGSCLFLYAGMYGGQLDSLKYSFSEFIDLGF